MFSGVWVEAPLLLKTLPEAWKIPSLIGAVSQLAQIGPILLYFAKCKCLACLPASKTRSSLYKRAISDRFIVYTLFIIGLSAGSLLALYWDRTMYVFGEYRSVAFFACVFCLAILDCTCTIVFLTYIGDFKGNYITGLYIGEGISSLLPSFFALLQGTGDYDTSSSHKCINSTTTSLYQNRSAPPPPVDNNVVVNPPRFSVSAYFWLLFSTLLVSFLAFLALDLWPGFKQEKISMVTKCQSDRLSDQNDEEKDRYYPEQKKSLLGSSKYSASVDRGKQNLDQTILLLGITLVSFTLYGFIPGLSSYSSLPYSDKIMHLCVTLGIVSIFFFLNIFHMLNIDYF